MYLLGIAMAVRQIAIMAVGEKSAGDRKTRGHHVLACRTQVKRDCVAFLRACVEEESDTYPLMDTNSRLGGRGMDVRDCNHDVMWGWRSG